MAPIVSCPGAPMLNRPVRNAKATLSPVKISGVASLRLSRKGPSAVIGAKRAEYTKYTTSLLASQRPHRGRGTPPEFTPGCTTSTTTAPTSTASAMATAGTSSPRRRLSRSHHARRALSPATAVISPPRTARKRPRFIPPPP